VSENIIKSDEVREYLRQQEGREVTLDSIRSEFGVSRGTKSFDAVRNIMYQFAQQRTVKPVGKRSGVYKVLVQVQPVKVFGQEHKSGLFNLVFPKDRDTEMEFSFAEDVVIREGDLILIAGVSNYGKTAIAMNFLAENIESSPVLLGNEFTSSDGQPTPRFVSRLESMDWVKWVNGTGEDKFTLLPVMSDYPEYIVKDRINILDWVNIETGEHYQIGTLLSEIKRAVGKGVGVAVIQKSEYATAGRGGQFTKDFADLELLIDKHGEMESRLTIGKCKESTKSLTGKSWAFGIFQGVKLVNIREVKKCKRCYGKNDSCPDCNGLGWVDK